MLPNMGSHHSQAMEDCIQNCQACHRVCIETVSHCLQMGGRHAEPTHIRLLHDCAQICQTSADFMIRHSDFHTQTCGVCADICERCAEDCERIDPGDPMMKTCADACRRCTESCREMAAGNARTA